MYFGLWDAQRKEPSRLRGYHRIFAGNAIFGISPPDLEGEDFSFVNLRPLSFPMALGPWGMMMTVPAFYEADDVDSRFEIPLNYPIYVSALVTAAFAPGQLRIGAKMTGKARAE